MGVIGFIGLGNMGGPMAANLVRHGHRVQGFDLAAASREAAASAGVTILGGVAETASGADTLLTMLPNGAAVLAVHRELAAIAAPGTLVIDSSTIDVEASRQAHALAEARGLLSLDAPVSGGTGGAAAGTLTFMTGGTERAFAQAHPILQAMGRQIVHCGGPGAGQAAKICNNMILGVSMIAVSEAFVLAERLGLSAQALFDVASTSSGQCWSLTSYCPVPGPVPQSPANRDYKPGFSSALMLKDLHLAQQAAESTGAVTALGRHAAELYERFAAAGGGDRDFSGIIEAIRKEGRG